MTLLPLLLAAPLAAQNIAGEPPKKWFEKLSIRGYAQLRHSGVAATDPGLQCEQCDRSLGGSQGFSIRRARLILSGDVHDRIFAYIQPDLASSPSSASQHFVQLRDLYFDVFLRPERDLRLRAGQSKVPFGWENMQSSSNRLALDRNDALNSAVANERDLGLFLYYSPRAAASRFASLTSSGLKGSGDYGVAGLGLYNGQTANRPEANRSLHAVARLSYPFLLGQQFIEPGIQGYSGKYVVSSSQRTAGVGGGEEFLDQRAAASLVIYPQPLGLQAEWNWGKGPEFDAESGTIRVKPLTGGYVQAMYRRDLGQGRAATPYVRAQYYRGGKKHETDARRVLTREIETGIEWQLHSALELTVAHYSSDRAYEDRGTRGNRRKGSGVRVQAQFNY